MSSVNIIEVKHLSKSFRKKRNLKGLLKKEEKLRLAVDDISFSVPEGKVFTLLGSNGSGKTTTVRMLANLLMPSSGEIYYRGKRMAADDPELRRKLVVVSQFNILQGALSVYQNIYQYYRMRMYSSEDCRRKTEQVLQEFDLAKYQYEKTRVLSGGYKRRIEIGRALADDAEIVFMDEPTTGLDPHSRLYVWDKVKQARADGKTIFLTTQMLEEAEQLADDVAFLKQGQLLTSLPIQELKTVFDKNIFQVEVEGAYRPESLTDFEVFDLQESSFKLHAGKDESAAELLEQLQEKGLCISSFSRKEASLEDIYLEVMKLGD